MKIFLVLIFCLLITSISYSQEQMQSSQTEAEHQYTRQELEKEIDAVAIFNSISMDFVQKKEDILHKPVFGLDLQERETLIGAHEIYVQTILVGSVAEQKDLRVGDIILKIDNQEPTTVDEAEQMLEAEQFTDQPRVLMVRHKGERINYILLPEIPICYEAANQNFEPFRKKWEQKYQNFFEKLIRLRLKLGKIKIITESKARAIIIERNKLLDEIIEADQELDEEFYNYLETYCHCYGR